MSTAQAVQQRSSTNHTADPPLAERLRPQALGEVLGQEHLLAKDGALQRMVQARRLRSSILWGPPGTGKTTLARLLARAVGASLHELSGSFSGIADIKKAISEAPTQAGRQHVVFVDEIHRFSRTQLDALLAATETGAIVLLGATTENPFAALQGPLLSRCLLLRLEPLERQSMLALLHRGAACLGVEVAPDLTERLLTHASGDARHALVLLEALRTAHPSQSLLTEQHLDRLGVQQLHGQTQERYYDEVAAWIHSMNGSDPQAAVYWLARLLAMGVDVRFLARRLCILAAEDIGLADPAAAEQAAACVIAVQNVGLPECALNLAACTLYMAQAPKSNRAAMALWQAQEWVKTHPDAPVPLPVRSRENHWHRFTGAGTGYRYPHDEGGFAPGQQYVPEQVRGVRFYVPTETAFEHHVADRMRQRESANATWARRKGTNPADPRVSDS